MAPVRRLLARPESCSTAGPPWLVVVTFARLVLEAGRQAVTGTAEAGRAPWAPRALLGGPRLRGRNAFDLPSVRRGGQAELRPEMADRIRVPLPTDSEEDDVRGDAGGRRGCDEENSKRPSDRAACL